MKWTDCARKKQQAKPDESAAKTPLGDEDRRELKRLTRRLREEAEAIRKAGEHMLPYDLDANLAGQLAEVAKSLEAMAKDLDDLQSTENPTQNDMDKLLEKLAKQLASGRRSFDEKASQPLEHLSKIFPLIADQQRFLMIAARQRDLAERLASVKGQDTVTDPATKARLRDLEGEQHRLRDELQSLLTDIENHARSLPEDEKLQELRASALKFAGAVKDSGAEAAMTDAESGADRVRRHARPREGPGSRGNARPIHQPMRRRRRAGRRVPRFSAGPAAEWEIPSPNCWPRWGWGAAAAAMGAGMSGGGYSARRGPGVGLYGSMPTLGGGDMAGGGFDSQNADQGAGGNATASPGGDPRTVADIRPSPKPAAAANLSFRRDIASASANISSGSPMKSAIRANGANHSATNHFQPYRAGRGHPSRWRGPLDFRRRALRRHLGRPRPQASRRRAG